MKMLYILLGFRILLCIHYNGVRVMTNAAMLTRVMEKQQDCRRGKLRNSVHTHNFLLFCNETFSYSAFGLLLYVTYFRSVNCTDRQYSNPTNRHRVVWGEVSCSLEMKWKFWLSQTLAAVWCSIGFCLKSIICCSIFSTYHRAHIDLDYVLRNVVTSLSCDRCLLSTFCISELYMVRLGRSLLIFACRLPQLVLFSGTCANTCNYTL